MIREFTLVNARGGVEYIRLEAKDTKINSEAKDTKINSEAKAKDRLFEDRPSRGQAPTTQRASVLKKKVLRAENPKFPVNFQTKKKKVMAITVFNKSKNSAVRGQDSFEGLEASTPRTSKCVLDVKDVLKDSTSGKCAWSIKWPKSYQPIRQ